MPNPSKQQAVHLRPVDGVSRVLGLVAWLAQKLDVFDPVRAAESQRHDVIFVPPIGNRDPANWIGTSEPLPFGQRPHLSVGVLALGASVALATVALVRPEFRTVGGGVDLHILGQALLVLMAVFLATDKDLRAIGFRVLCHLRDHLIAMTKVRGGLDRFHSSWVTGSCASLVLPVAFNAPLSAGSAQGGVTTSARDSREIEPKSRRSSISTRDDLNLVQLPVLSVGAT